jgi:hypothetical protein
MARPAVVKLRTQDLTVAVLQIASEAMRIGRAESMQRLTISILDPDPPTIEG